MSKAFEGAVNKGRQAFRGGKPREAPYKDKRKPSGKLSWSRAFIRAWEDGWDKEKQKREAKKESGEK